MFSLFSNTSPKDPSAASLQVQPLDRAASKSLKRTATVAASGIKAEQERSDILREQIVLLSEKAAHAYDKVAETEAENLRLAEKVLNLEALLKEKSTLSKRKTTNQELLDLKIKNSNLEDKVFSQNNELARLRKENKSLKDLNAAFADKTSTLERLNKDLASQCKSLQTSSNKFQTQCDGLQAEIATLKASSNSTTEDSATEDSTAAASIHERDNSISSLSSKSSTMFSFTRNSSTDDVNKLALSPVGSSTNTHDMVAELHKQMGAYKKKNEILVAQVSAERQKKTALLNSFRACQEKTALLASFNGDYIKQLNEKLAQMKHNETVLKSKMDLIQTNMSIIHANKGY